MGLMVTFLLRMMILVELDKVVSPRVTLERELITLQSVDLTQDLGMGSLSRGAPRDQIILF